MTAPKGDFARPPWQPADPAPAPAVSDRDQEAAVEAMALTFETDGEIISALAQQARQQFDLAAEAAYALTASDFQHVAKRLRARAAALASDGTGP